MADLLEIWLWTLELRVLSWVLKTLADLHTVAGRIALQTCLVIAKISLIEKIFLRMCLKGRTSSRFNQYVCEILYGLPHLLKAFLISWYLTMRWVEFNLSGAWRKFWIFVPDLRQADIGLAQGLMRHAVEILSPIGWNYWDASATACDL